MDRVLKFVQVLNQIVWILVGLATLYSIYYFIQHNPLDQLTKSLGMPGGSDTTQQRTSLQNLQSNPQAQKLLQQYLQQK